MVLKISEENSLDRNPTKIAWSSSLMQLWRRKYTIHEEIADRIGCYRPFCKMNLIWQDELIHRKGQWKEVFPDGSRKNLVICVSAPGGTQSLSVLISDCIADLHFTGDTQCFPLYYYEKQKEEEQSLFGEKETYIRHDGVTDFALSQARDRYGSRVTKEDIFYYVYGFLNLPSYRETFSADLKKSLPRIPFVESPNDFWDFSKAGRELAELHLHYEDQPAPEGILVEGDDGNYRVTKMRFPQKGQKDTILYNDHISITHIPPAVYDYVVNGRSAVEWIMERYQVRTDKKSGITNDPNDWAKEHEKPRYILDLLLSVMTVSLKTQAIVAGLPKITF